MSYERKLHRFLELRKGSSYNAHVRKTAFDRKARARNKIRKCIRPYKGLNIADLVAKFDREQPTPEPIRCGVAPQIRRQSHSGVIGGHVDQDRASVRRFSSETGKVESLASLVRLRDGSDRKRVASKPPRRISPGEDGRRISDDNPQTEEVTTCNDTSAGEEVHRISIDTENGEGVRRISTDAEAKEEIQRISDHGIRQQDAKSDQLRKSSSRKTDMNQVAPLSTMESELTTRLLPPSNDSNARISFVFHQPKILYQNARGVGSFSPSSGRSISRPESCLPERKLKKRRTKNEPILSSSRTKDGPVPSSLPKEIPAEPVTSRTAPRAGTVLSNFHRIVSSLKANANDELSKMRNDVVALKNLPECPVSALVVASEFAGDGKPTGDRNGCAVRTTAVGKGSGESEPATKHIHPCACDLTKRQRDKILQHLQEKLRAQLRFEKRVREIEEEIRRLQEEEEERRKQEELERELYGDEYEMDGDKKKRKKRSARRASMVSLGVKQIINWKKSPKIKVRYTKTFELRKANPTYCKPKEDFLAMPGAINILDTPEGEVRETRTSEMRADFNKKLLIDRKKKRLILKYPDRPEFVLKPR